MPLSPAKTESSLGSQPGATLQVQSGDGAADPNAMPTTMGVEDSIPGRDPETPTRSFDAIGSSLRGAQQNVSRWARATLDEIGTFADERPIHFAAIVAGSAFAIGVALRIWRFAHDE
ncbi:MAG TPA: hypothetical protein VFA85_15085 [Terriglobales bacterium]|nr:hypothetical protein [Terriglobales bacterium]